MIAKKQVMMLKVVLVLGLASSVFADGHYAYSEQYIKKFHDPHAHSGHHGELSHIGSHKPEHHEGYAWAYPGYEFSYKVEDHHTHDYKGQHEVRDGDQVKGMYWLIQPDGKKRTVTYHADKHSGFHAHVEYSEPDHHVHHEHKHEDHQEPEHHVKHEEHHKENGDHNKYNSKPYEYHISLVHPKPHKHLEHHDKHHVEVHKEHHEAPNKEHHEEPHKEHHEEVHKGYLVEEHKKHNEKHHVPHSDYHVHIKHYYGHHDNKYHNEHKHVEHDHKKHDVKLFEPHHKEHDHKHYDEHHGDDHYDLIKKIYANLKKPHYEHHQEQHNHGHRHHGQVHNVHQQHHHEPHHYGHHHHGYEHHKKYDHDHVLYIDHKLLEELRKKAYQAFKAHEEKKHREHHEHHYRHGIHHEPVYHERQKYFHHIPPMYGRNHHGH